MYMLHLKTLFIHILVDITESTFIDLGCLLHNSIQYKLIRLRLNYSKYVCFVGVEIAFSGFSVVLGYVLALMLSV